MFVQTMVSVHTESKHAKLQAKFGGARQGLPRPLSGEPPDQAGGAREGLWNEAADAGKRRHNEDSPLRQFPRLLHGITSPRHDVTIRRALPKWKA